MSFTDSKYLKLKAETQNAVNALIIKRNEEHEVKLRLEHVSAEYYHDPTIEKDLEVRRVQALMDHVKNATQVAHERAIELTVKLSKTINKRNKESNMPEAGAEMAFVESLCDPVWGKPQPPPPQ